ncbi:MAG: amidohydrolase family protein [Saprospiraceae bacterium]|nr:amidohydrolase family protein [Saprospiraceae bacterium]
MTSKTILFFFLLCMEFGLSAQTYISHVTLADVEKQKYIPDQTVVITNKIISKIQSSGSITIPDNAIVIDGSGKYLIPGLIDAHVHFSQTGGLYTRPDAIDLRKVKPYQDEIKWSHDHMEEVLRRYLRNGITSVIDVGTTPNFQKQRGLFKDAIFAPDIFMSGPLLTTYEPDAFKNLSDDNPFNLVTSIEEAREMVRKQLVFHPDFIKIWYIVGMDTSDLEVSAQNYLPIVKAIIEEAHKNNVHVAVHATELLTAKLSVENGCDFLVHSIDDKLLPDDFIQLLKKKNTILCPTLTVHDGYVKTFGQRLALTDYELSNGDPFQIGSLLDLQHLGDTTLVKNYKAYINSPREIASAQKVNTTMAANLKKLTDAGVVIVTGTDAGNIGTLHASSYLAELMAMQSSGMNNWQILQASTINGAKVLGREKEFGSISEGKKANLVLLDADPVADLENTTKIYRVINKGVVIDPDTLIQETPTALAQRQLNGYNFRNIEAFLEPYADDVEVYNFPDKLLFQGKEEMRKAYATRFENASDVHCELLNRIVHGNMVIDKERIQEGGKKRDAIAMFQIAGDKIQKVYFIR